MLGFLRIRAYAELKSRATRSAAAEARRNGVAFNRGGEMETAMVNRRVANLRAQRAARRTNNAAAR